MNAEPCRTRQSSTAEVCRLRISDDSDRELLDAFRFNLASSDSRLIILSAFLSPNEASSYYPAMHALGALLLAQAEIACPICVAEMNVIRGAFLRVACTSQGCGFSLVARIASGLSGLLKRRPLA